MCLVDHSLHSGSVKPFRDVVLSVTIEGGPSGFHEVATPPSGGRWLPSSTQRSVLGGLPVCQGGFSLLPQRCLPSPAVPAGTRHNFRRMTQAEEKQTRQKEKKKAELSRLVTGATSVSVFIKGATLESFLTLFSFAALWWLFRISKEISIFWRDLWSWFSFVFLYLKTLHADPIKARRLLCWKMRDLMWANGLQLFKHWARVLAYRF